MITLAEVLVLPQVVGDLAEHPLDAGEVLVVGRRRRRSPRATSSGSCCRPAGSRRWGRTRRSRRASRSRVTRRLTASTVPMASPRSTTSPTPYWSSKIMKTPERKSLTSDWAPKPSAMPMIPALAMIGAMLTPSWLRIIVPNIATSTPVMTLLSRSPMVLARCTRRVCGGQVARRGAARRPPGGCCRRENRPTRPGARRPRPATTSRSTSRWRTKRSTRPSTTRNRDGQRVADQPVREVGGRLVAGPVVDLLADVFARARTGRSC